MEKRNISFSPPDITDAEIEEVSKVLRSGWITTGPRTKKLENRLAQYCNTNKVVCLNSATAAEELNLRILGIGEGDEVIVPAYTYTATAAAVIHVGAKVIFIDSQIDNAEMDYIALEKAITEKTKAIVAVDLGGIICDYNRIFEIVEKKKKFLEHVMIFKKRSEELQCLQIVLMHLEQVKMEKWPVKLQILHHSHFMQLRILQLLKEELQLGRRLMELMMKCYINNINYILYMVKARML